VGKQCRRFRSVIAGFFNWKISNLDSIALAIESIHIETVNDKKRFKTLLLLICGCETKLSLMTLSFQSLWVELDDFESCKFLSLKEGLPTKNVTESFRFHFSLTVQNSRANAEQFCEILHH
jgi:hypothetical protein